MQDDLKERLRAMVTNRPDSLGICTSWHRNPDGPEAADRIAALEDKLAEKDAQLAEARAENERLREALTTIFNEGGQAEARFALAALGDWKSGAGDLGGSNDRHTD